MNDLDIEGTPDSVEPIEPVVAVEPEKKARFQHTEEYKRKASRDALRRWRKKKKLEALAGKKEVKSAYIKKKDRIEVSFDTNSTEKHPLEGKQVTLKVINNVLMGYDTKVQLIYVLCKL